MKSVDAVWIFLNTEKPRSESAFDAGVVNKPLISLVKTGNLGSPLN